MVLDTLKPLVDVWETLLAGLSGMGQEEEGGQGAGLSGKGQEDVSGPEAGPPRMSQVEVGGQGARWQRGEVECTVGTPTVFLCVVELDFHQQHGLP